ncbi:GGDEF domain-containing protein [Paenibacillus methanolicus]|uniref:Diguanylate cyclase (GGDEF)-like protein n=1 Tax=Paenibacillus methanolicus TaxID=582686 RepID=A0A5S5C5U1_9BACL|nr:GGDEF domain-containing protein [Paenibacillus methanolicus]TYP74704.1 diguanylate cyclase (GGDEF)-like protein [Paenibacillus methanolicus]
MRIELTRSPRLLAPSIYRYATIGGLLIHLAFAAFFYALGYSFMAWLNLGSSACYAVAMRLLKRDRMGLWGCLVASELLIYAVVATVHMGWSAGFHYYLFFVLYGAYVTQTSKLASRAFVTVSMIAYVLLYRYAPSGMAGGGVPVCRMLHYLNLISTLGYTTLLSYYYRQSIDSTMANLHDAIQELELLSRTDPLTGLRNRRMIYERLEEARLRHEREGVPFSLLLADIDGFKQVNDRYGHNCGDAAIRHCASLIEEAAGDGTLAVRWGGEEFLVLLQGKPLQEAEALAERIRSEAERREFRHEAQFIPITLTIGVASHRAGQRVDECIHLADVALIEGKRAGKNRVVASR